MLAETGWNDMTDKAAAGKLKSDGWTIVETSGFLHLVGPLWQRRPTLATVQFDAHFVEAGKIGEILVSKPHVVRTTRSLIFITTEVTVDKRCIAMASGVFKILRNE